MAPLVGLTMQIIIRYLDDFQVQSQLDHIKLEINHNQFDPFFSETSTSMDSFKIILLRQVYFFTLNNCYMLLNFFVWLYPWLQILSFDFQNWLEQYMLKSSATLIHWKLSYLAWSWDSVKVDSSLVNWLLTKNQMMLLCFRTIINLAFLMHYY